MTKQTCWFGWVKRIFVFGAKPKEEKKPRKWRWTLGRLRIRYYPALAASGRSLSGATHEQRQHALNVAAATAAAAEAAVAAARAAAEVVRLTGSSESRHLIPKRDPNLAATAIQSAFRAYLARKALRALKGLVRLQAIVRGRAVRRKTRYRMKRFTSHARMQSEVHRRSDPFDYGHCRDGEKRLFVRQNKEYGDREIKYVQRELNSPRNWDFSRLSKEDMEMIRSKKQEAIMKRERMKRYSFSHRERRNGHMTEELALGKRAFWLEHWGDVDVHNSEGAETLKSSSRSNKITSEMSGATKIGVRNTNKQDLEGFYIPYSFPRRSFSHGKHNMVGAEESSTMSNSPMLPTYMAATESARAKLRSMSTSKRRQVSMDTFSDHNLRCKHGISFSSSSYNCDSKYGVSQPLSITMNRIH